MKLSQTLYEMMLLRTMTIYELAYKSGVSHNAIYHILNNKHETTTLSTVKKLAEALGCTAGWLLRK